MKRLIAVCAAALAFSTTIIPVGAAPAENSNLTVHTRTTTMAFRVTVKGRVASSTTFWVAYGPLGGRFGVIRLHRAGSGVYVAAARLPQGGSTDFAYIAGTGTVQTQAGPQPGDPTVTIRTFQRVSPGARQLPGVTFHAPVG